MYNYFRDNIYYPNVPLPSGKFMMPKEFEFPFDMAYPPMGGYNPMNMPQNPNYTQNNNPYKTLNKNMLNLNNDVRKLWIDHVIWTKLVMMSIASGSPDVQLVSQRLLKNADDFGALFMKFYGPTVAEKIRDLIRQHLLISADLVNASKKKDTASINTIEKKLFKNADEIANFLSLINPYWDKDDMRKMIYSHLSLLKSESTAILTNKYEESIELFDKVEDQALMMANAFIEGILKQFPNKF
jgi:hypothetical protein